MTNIQAIEWLERLAQEFERKARASQEDIDIQVWLANAKSARNIAKLLI